MPSFSAANFAGTPILSDAQIPSRTAAVSFVPVPTGRPFFVADFFRCLSVRFLCCMSALRFATSERFPALHGYVDVQWVKLDGDATAIKHLRGDDGRARPAKRLVDHRP